jgi:superfamily II DNA or RNA helicase
LHAHLPLFSLLAVKYPFMANNEQNVPSEESHHVQEQIRNVQRQLQDLDAQKTILLSLLEKLEKRCHTQVSPRPTVVHYVQPRTPTSAVRGDDMALLASLFRGREDVFPKRWEGRDGKCGYSPACQNEWVRGVCDKPRTKCSECLHRKFVPLTEEILHRHLKGQMTIGVYPLLKDETCYFLAVDFDKKEWMDDVSAFASTCQKRDLTCAVERSRSGKGAHVWFFFEQPISARLARRFGCALLTETMEQRHRVGLDSYDRLFPNQDTMPQGGFGNLIALPLQAGPARAGNSLFVNTDFVPYPDQWAFLRSLKRLSEAEVRAIEEDAAKRGRILGVRMSVDDEAGDQPWMLPPSRRMKAPVICGTVPPEIRAVLSNLLYLGKPDLPSGLINQLIRLAAFQNPDFYQAQAMRLSTFGKPRIISCAEEFPKHIALPRGCMEEVTALIHGLGSAIVLEDKRAAGRALQVSFHGTLTEEQEQAVTALLRSDTGVLSAPTAFGKTVVGARLIAERQVNTLVLVHRKQLLDQWRASLSAFLGVDEQSVGQIGGGKNRPTGLTDVAMLQSLQRKGVVADIMADYGQVIVDECHHVSAFTFEQVLRRANAKYVLGLTATPTRKDGHHPIVFMQCGPIRYALSDQQMARSRLFEHKVITRETATTLGVPEQQAKIHDVYWAIQRDSRRTDLIIADAREAVRAGRCPVILTERREHLEMLSQRLNDLAGLRFVLHGGMGEKQRRETLRKLFEIPDGQPRVLLATGKYLGEGFDDARLDTLFLTMPISWRGILQQYAGRLHRAHQAKKEVVIYDYVDMQIPMAVRMFERRKKGYAAIGYTVADALQPSLDLTNKNGESR